MRIYKRIKGIISERVVNPLRTIRLTSGQEAREKVHQQRATRGNPHGGPLGVRSRYEYGRRRKHMTTGQRSAEDVEFARRATPNLPK